MTSSLKNRGSRNCRPRYDGSRGAVGGVTVGSAIGGALFPLVMFFAVSVGANLAQVVNIVLEARDERSVFNLAPLERRLRGELHRMEADLDVSGLEYAAKFVIAADVDGDGRQELVIVPDVAGSAGNDLWVRKFNNDPAAPGWFPLSPIAGHGLEADLDVSGLEYAAKFVIAADVDGDGRQELVIVPDVAGSAGNDLWVRKFNNDPAAPGWFPLSPIAGHGLEADLDVSGSGVRGEVRDRGRCRR